MPLTSAVGRAQTRPGGVSGFAVCRRRPGRAQPPLLVEGQFGEELPLAVGEFPDAVVETGYRHARVVVMQGCDEAGDLGGRVGYGTAEGAGVNVLVGTVQLDLALGQAAHAGAHGGGVLGPHAGVGDDDHVGGEPLGVLLDEGAEVRGAGLLLALDQHLQVDGGGGPAGGGEVGADTQCVEEHLPLVVGRPARVETVSADHRFERLGLPAVRKGRGLHVVVPVDQDRGGVGVRGGPFREDGGGARRLPDLGGGEACLLELGGQPVGAAPYVRRMLGLGRHRRDAQPLHEVVEEGGTVVLDVRADDADVAVNGLAHAHEPIGPHRHARPAVRP